MPDLARIPQVGAAHPRVRQYFNIKNNQRTIPLAVALEGLWALRSALDAGIDIEVTFVCPDLVRGDETNHIIDHSRNNGAVVLRVSAKVLKRMVDRDGPDGLAAVAHLRSWRLDDIAVGPTTRLVVVDGMELAGNLGTVIRCADGAGASAVILTSKRTRITHPRTLRASMGTVFSTPVIDSSTDEATDWLRSHRVRVVAAHPTATTSYRGPHYQSPVAVVFGSERYGLAPAWQTAADALVSIPMLGVADSLNTGHAAALLLYEALHQHE